MTNNHIPPQQPQPPLSSPPSAGPPPGWYPFADVKGQVRWWNGYVWEHQWRPVPLPGRKFTWGAARWPDAQIVVGIIVGVICTIGGLFWGLAAPVFFADSGGQVLISMLLGLASLLMGALGFFVAYDGKIGLQRKRDRQRVGSY